MDPLLVRAGATVVWSTYSLNRDPRRYGEDWAEFRPDRWATLVEAKGTTPTIAQAPSAIDSSTGGDVGKGDTNIGEQVSWRAFFMPFGSGPRSCLGQRMVQTEVAYVLVRLLQEFPTMTLDDQDVGKPFREAEAVSFYNEGGVHIRVD